METNVKHALKTTSPYTKGKKQYLRSIIGRLHKGNWVPYLFEKGSQEPITPELTLKIINGHETPTISAESLSEIAKGKRKAIKEFKKKRHADKQKNRKAKR